MDRNLAIKGGQNGISEYLAKHDVGDVGYPSARTVDTAMERRGTVESCRQQTPSVVRLYFYLQYTGDTRNNLYLRIQQEESELETAPLQTDL